MSDRQKEINRDLSPTEIDEVINTAQPAEEARLVRRLNWIKNLYTSDTLEDAG